MAEASSIAWCRSTFNPWLGCTKLTSECNKCYAEKNVSVKFLGVKWGDKAERHVQADSTWKHPFTWNRKAAREGEPWLVFGGSLCDYLDDRAPQGQFDRLMETIRQTPRLTWLMLTKRHGNFHKLPADLPRNAWIGVTAGTQDRLVERVSALRKVDAAVRWVSYEPALWPIDLNAIGRGVIDWLVCGCESGKGRRPMDIRWARDAWRQCKALGIAFFAKQFEINGEVTDDITKFPADLRVRQYPEAR